jgi:hypothetical protein
MYYQIQTMFDDIIVEDTLNGVNIEIYSDRGAREAIITLDRNMAANLINALIEACRGDKGITIAPSALNKI